QLCSLVQELQQHTRSLGDMVQASFDLSRLDAGTWDVSIREVALPHLIEKVASEFRSTAAEKGVVFDLGAVPPYLVLSDPEALGRILRNLIGNAIKYTPAETQHGPGRVVVECAQHNELMRIIIVDNGMGIPPNRQKDIFKEYVQLDNPERDRTKGFGLGL